MSQSQVTVQRSQVECLTREGDPNSCGINIYTSFPRWWQVIFPSFTGMLMIWSSTYRIFRDRAAWFNRLFSQSFAGCGNSVVNKDFFSPPVKQTQTNCLEIHGNLVFFFLSNASWRHGHGSLNVVSPIINWHYQPCGGYHIVNSPKSQQGMIYSGAHLKMNTQPKPGLWQYAYNTHTNVCVHIYITYVYVYIHIYIYICVCYMYMYIYIYIIYV